MENICDGIRESHRYGEGLRLLIKDKKVFVADDKSHPKSYPYHCPAKTLQELLADFSFFDYEHYNPAIATDNKFLTLEKRSLAASLVLSHSIYLCCKFAVEPWNPGQVYFLTGTEGHCMRDTAYALCFVDGKHIPPESTGPTTSSNQPAIDLTQLAKLLLEIEFGVRLDDKVKIDSNETNDSARKSLENLISDGLCNPRDLGQPAYLQAVQECLKLDRTCRRRMRHQAGLVQTDYIATARSVMYTEIAEKIRAASKSSCKRRRSSMCSPEDEDLGYQYQADFGSPYRQTARSQKRLKNTSRHETARQRERLPEASDIMVRSGDYGGNETQTARLSSKVNLRYMSLVNRGREFPSCEKNQQSVRPGVVGRLLFDDMDLDQDTANPKYVPSRSTSAALLSDPESLAGNQ